LTLFKETPLARKPQAFGALPEADLSALTHLQRQRRTFVAGYDLLHQGQSKQPAYILSEG